MSPKDAAQRPSEEPRSAKDAPASSASEFSNDASSTVSDESSASKGREEASVSKDDGSSMPTSRPALRARFLVDLPKDPNLEALAEAFERGNYAKVRREAPKLVEQAPSNEVREAAEDLLRRIEPDPLMKYLLVLSVVLFVVVTAFVYGSHGHP